ncbi:MAG: alpha/beta fold hydrolase, partial [Clostridia bacterium]
MKRRGVRIALICVLGVVILLAAASMVAGDYFYQLALDPTFEVRRGQSKDAQDKPKDAPHFADADWFAQCNAQEQWITSTDALRLHAYALEQENNNRWVVICHGYGGNGLKMTGFARAFAERGFQVLLPDARAHGQSEGTYRGMGWDDRL